MKIDRQDIFRAIEFERERQDKLHPMAQTKHEKGSDEEIMHNYILTNDFMAILVEEVGEIARALQGEGNLVDELTQCASVCVRWLESIK